MDSAQIYSEQIATLVEPGEAALAALMCQYAHGEERTGPADDTVTFDPLNGLSVPAWERAAGEAIMGVTLVGTPGSLAHRLMDAMADADHLIWTDRRLLAADLGNPATLAWAVPRDQVAEVRVDARMLQQGRIRVVFADGSMLRLLAGMLFAGEAHRFAAAVHGE